MTRKQGDRVTSAGIVIDGIFNGMSYEGPVLNIKHDDPQHMLPRLVAEVTVDTFTMDNPKDVEKYTKYMEDVGRGWAEVSREEVQWMPERQTWKIFLRMMHKKYIAPEDMSRVQESNT